MGVHRIAVTRLCCHPETQNYIERKRAEGKSSKDAIRGLKRHLTRRIWRLLQPPAPTPDQTPAPSTPRHWSSETASCFSSVSEPTGTQLVERR